MTPEIRKIKKNPYELGDKFYMVGYTKVNTGFEKESKEVDCYYIEAFTLSGTSVGYDGSLYLVLSSYKNHLRLCNAKSINKYDIGLGDGCFTTPGRANKFAKMKLDKVQFKISKMVFDNHIPSKCGRAKLK